MELSRSTALDSSCNINSQTTHPPLHYQLETAEQNYCPQYNSKEMNTTVHCEESDWRSEESVLDKYMLQHKAHTKGAGAHYFLVSFHKGERTHGFAEDYHVSTKDLQWIASRKKNHFFFWGGGVGERGSFQRTIALRASLQS